VLAVLALVAFAIPAPSDSASVAIVRSRAAPATYYVSLTGSDANQGTLSAPWRTVQKAASTVGPGSTVYVRGGVYNEAVTVSVSGSAELGKTRFESFPGELAVLDGTGLDVPDGASGLFLVVDKSYLVLRGFELRNYSSAERGIVPVGIYIGGSSHDIEIRDNRIHHIETRFEGADGGDAHAVAVYGTSASESIHDVVIDGNELDDLKLGSSEALALNGNVERFAVTNNRVHDANNIGIDCIGFEGTAPNPAVDQARNGMVSDNTVYNIDSFGNPAYGEDRSAGGIYVDGGRDIVIERNVVHHADIGVELASEHRGRSTSGITLRNNFVYFNLIVGISMGGYDKRRGSTEGCVVVNNTLFHNDTLETGTGEIDLQFATRNNAIRNNIVCAGPQGRLIGNGFKTNRGNVVDSNLYSVPPGAEAMWQWRRKAYTSFEQYRAATGNDARSMVADPKLADPSTPDLHVLPASPAIDAGDDGVDAGPLDIDRDPRVQGGRIDIGADEARPSRSSTRR
jgi:hypothetical protein